VFTLLLRQLTASVVCLPLSCSTKIQAAAGFLLTGIGISTAEREKENAAKQAGTAGWHFVQIVSCPKLLHELQRVHELPDGPNILNGSRLGTASQVTAGTTLLKILYTHASKEYLIGLGEDKRAKEIARRVTVLRQKKVLGRSIHTPPSVPSPATYTATH
jgi:hypothetical protein